MTVANVSLLPHIKGILDASGVQYFVKNEGLQNLLGWGSVGLGFNNVFGPPVVMVSADQSDLARELLKPFDTLSMTEPRSSADSGGTAMDGSQCCSRCGQLLEADDGDEPLTHCYHCGWSLVNDGIPKIP